MKKRLTAAFLALGMLANQYIITSASESGQNAYGHDITYKPVTQLYSGGEPVKFFDAGLTEWGSLSEKITTNEAESIKWLQSNNYLLNHFGRYLSGKLTSGLNSKGEWQTYMKGPTNSKKWYATVQFDLLAEKSGRENGNISNMHDKGDIKYFFSHKVKTVQTRWGLTGKSNDTGQTYALGETINSKGGGWKKYNTLGDGPNLFYSSAWKNADDLSVISFMAYSDRDNQVDSYLSGAMLVGKDIKGPKIASVDVTADSDGKNKIENGAITLDTIEKLNDRTIYFRVQWDEPIIFKNLSSKELEKLTLHVSTIGTDGTSGIIAEAPFLKFEPTIKDGKPVMVFEYKIPDPYIDSSSVTQERGYFYKFSSVTISENENSTLWKKIYDLSGNKFAADENGQQPSGKVTATVNNSARVDLTPFGISKIQLTKNMDDSTPFIQSGELLSVTLALNKPMADKTALIDLPVITLNIKDSSGKYVTVKPSFDDLEKKAFYRDYWGYGGYYKDNNGNRLKSVVPSEDKRSITYHTQIFPEYKQEGTSVQVISVTSDSAKVKDSSGYPLMDYTSESGTLTPKNPPNAIKDKISKYQLSPDKQYKLDFDAPKINVSMDDFGEGIIMFEASVDDASTEGCDAAFTIKVNGTAENDALSYQGSASESYKDSEWKQSADGTAAASFSAPIVYGGGENKAYGFIKLPSRSEADKIEVSVTATDEAGNSASIEKSFSAPEWSGFDTLAPTIKASVRYEIIDISVSDIDDNVEYMYGFSDNDTDEPAYTTERGKSGTIVPPEIPSDGTIHSKVAWIKASDSKGNTSEPLKLPIKLDRTYTTLSCTANTDKIYTGEDFPSADILVENAKGYWYMWVEKPANVSDVAAYISESCLDDIKQRAADCGYAEELEDDDPETEQSNNSKTLFVYLNSAAQVAGINAGGESYGENISPDKTTRPVILVVAAEKDDGSTLIKTLEFNTFYGAPRVSLSQNRFSTNNSDGKRVDYIRGSEAAALLWASDSENLNTPCLYGFAQAEFLLSGDPVTGIERVNMEESSLILKKVIYNVPNFYGSTTEKSSDIVGEWKLSDMNFSKLSGGTYSACLDIDPKLINCEYYEIQEDGNFCFVQYEFESSMKYAEGISPTDDDITYFAFNNTPKAFLFDTAYDSTEHYNYFKNFGQKNTEAIFDSKGNDITPTIPIYTISTGYTSELSIRFAAPCGNRGMGVDKLFYKAPVQNTVDPDNTEKLVLRIGTDPNNLSEYLPFITNYYAGVVSEPFYIGDYFSGDENELLEKTLYYQFESPEHGSVSPIYVLTLRRDNVPPVVDLSISETERMTNEVLVKLNGVYDTQTAPDGTVVIDTPNPECFIEAFIVVNENEEINPGDFEIEPRFEEMLVYYDEETNERVYAMCMQIFPDEDGIYHFTNIGYIRVHAQDDAENITAELLINGESINARGGDFTQYDILNVDTFPPQFINEPKFISNEESGSFTISAKTFDAAKAYLKFDDDYTGILSENGSKFELKNVPGLISGKLNEKDGTLTAEIYVKYSESVPLSSASLIIEDIAGNETEYTHTFDKALSGKKPKITNTKNENGYPVYGYGGSLSFNVPVKLGDFDTEYALSHENLPIYSDGITEISYTDLFGESRYENIYSNVFGEAFAHSLIFSANGEEISPQTPVSSDVTVKIDTSKTENLSLNEDKTEFTFTENGALDYSLTNTKLGQTKQFSIPVTNIDKTAPEAIVSINLESEYNSETNTQCIYSATYSIEGFSEDGVSLISSDSEAAPSFVTFDYTSKEKTHTFLFRDAAGNEGSYTADASDITFAQRTDGNIAKYRLTYSAADSNGFRTLGQFEPGQAPNIGLVNKAVSVKVEALNQNEEPVPASISAKSALPQGTSVLSAEKLVMFTTESNEERALNLTLTGTTNSIDASVSLPADTIDLTAPTGTVLYMPDGQNVKAYLVTDDTDLAEDGIYVIGTKADGTAFELKSDGSGYYTEFDKNGAGKFVMTDRAGNVGTVAIAVLTIDKEPPQVVSEGWQSVVDARTREEIAALLSTPTNNSIKLFINFNEQLKSADVKAFNSVGETEELLPTDEYVTVQASGCSLTVEFIQNCRAKLTVYDLRGNACTLWRPEDGPISVIDKDAPKLANAPVRTIENNIVTIEYVFADGEEVMLLQVPDEKAEKNPDDRYKNKHVITIKENGQKIFSFADRAGNVFTDYPVVSEIDDLAPVIKMSVDFVGSGKELSAEESYKAGNMYTNKNVRILLNVTDEKTPDGISVKAETKSGTPIEVKKENITSNGKNYNYCFVVSENGAYKVTATDKWAHENTVETRVSVIDKTAPTIRFNGASSVIKAGTDESTAQNLILADAKAEDSQSGANAPIGDKIKDVTDGVTLKLDLSNVNLSKPGAYTAKITAADRLGNTSEKLRTVSVVTDAYIFNINGESIYANDVFTTSKGTIKLQNASKSAKYYYAQGHKTAAQMKYAKGFEADKGFKTLQKGYYTILAQEENRKMYLLYVYIN